MFQDISLLLEKQQNYTVLSAFFFLLSSKKYVVEYQNLVVTVLLHFRTEFVKYEIDPRHCKLEFCLKWRYFDFPD